MSWSSRPAPGSLPVSTILWCGILLRPRPADDPFLGAWKLNVQKSQASSGQVPAGRTMKIESDAKDLVLTLEGGGIATPQKQRLTFNDQEQSVASTPLAKRTGATAVVY